MSTSTATALSEVMSLVSVTTWRLIKPSLEEEEEERFSKNIFNEATTRTYNHGNKHNNEKNELINS
jgi:hypothetical protein